MTLRKKQSPGESISSHTIQRNIFRHAPFVIHHTYLFHTFTFRFPIPPSPCTCHLIEPHSSCLNPELSLCTIIRRPHLSLFTTHHLSFANCVCPPSRHSIIRHALFTIHNLSVQILRASYRFVCINALSLHEQPGDWHLGCPHLHRDKR